MLSVDGYFNNEKLLIFVSINYGRTKNCAAFEYASKCYQFVIYKPPYKATKY